MSGRTRSRQLQIITPEEELENLRNEVGVLRRAVESKSAAVGILRAELQECQRERDKFRTLAEQGTLHRSSSTVSKPAYSDPCRSAMLSGSDGTLAQLLSQSKEENKMLRQDATELRCKLHDAQADIKVLREEIQRSRGSEGRRRSHVHTTMSQLAHQEREQFISQMEELNAKSQALEGDVRGLVEEREELVRELDASYHKLHRLNYILNTVLSNTSPASTTNPPKRIIDLDAVITENRYLQQRLKQTEEEKVLARSNASKYKAALEKCRSQGSLKLGTSENLIVTPQQVCELLHDYRGEVGGAAESDLKSLCVALVDALNQRSRALRTQRSANKVLVTRVAELERRLSTIGSPEDTKVVENVIKSTGAETPGLQLASLGLMDGYTPPAGPITKYNEDITQDPRLERFVNALSPRKEPGEGVKDDKDLDEDSEDSKVSDILKNSSNENGLILRRNSKDTSNIPYSKIKLQASNSSLKDSTSVTSNKNALVQTKSDYEKKVFSVEEKVQSNKSDRQVMHVNESVDDCEKLNIPQDDSIHSDKSTSKSKGTIKSVKGGKTGRRELLGLNCASTKETNVHNTLDKKMAPYVNPEDDLEEIIPIDQLDSYIREVQLRRKQLVNNVPDNASKSGNDVNGTSNFSNNEENITHLEDDTAEGTDLVDEIEPSARQVKDVDERDDDSSFDLNISDYDSDNDNLDVALQEWQNDFGKGKMLKIKGSPTKDLKAKGAGRKDGFNLWRKDSSPETELSSALQDLLDKATAATLTNGTNCT